MRVGQQKWQKKSSPGKTSHRFFRRGKFTQQICYIHGLKEKLLKVQVEGSHKFQMQSAN